jgi:hypothetical protein
VILLEVRVLVSLVVVVHRALIVLVMLVIIIVVAPALVPLLSHLVYQRFNLMHGALGHLLPELLVVVVLHGEALAHL